MFYLSLLQVLLVTSRLYGITALVTGGYAMAKRDIDAQFFEAHPDRQAHIRNPVGSEYEMEFRTLGDHLASRRRILVWRVHHTKKLMKIPFLAFADESIEDTDEVLLPILDGIMKQNRWKLADA